MNEVLFSSAQQDWETPPELFEVLDDVFCFDLDAAASEANRLCDDYFSAAGENAFEANWWDYAYRHSIFLNPPYGRNGNISAWMDLVVGMHFADNAPKDGNIVLLLPNRTSESWFQLVAKHASLQLQIAGWLKFRLNGVEQNSAPFGSIVLVLGPIPRGIEKLTSLGLLQAPYIYA